MDVTSVETDITKLYGTAYSNYTWLPLLAVVNDSSLIIYY